MLPPPEPSLSPVLSPFAGKSGRQDRYGGSLENRARFLIEILKAIREEVGRKHELYLNIDVYCTG